MIKIKRKKLLASILSIAMLISFMPAMTLTVNAAEPEPYTATVNDSLPLLVSELSGLDNLSDIISSGVCVQGYTQPSSGSNIAKLYFVDPDITTDAGEVEYLTNIDVVPSDIVESEDETIYFKADTAGEYTFHIRIYDYDTIDVTRKITVTVTDGDTTKPTLTAGAVNRTSNTTATVNFTSDTEGSYYYKVVGDGDVEPTIDTDGVGTTCATSETTITNPIGLTAGAMDIYIIVKDGTGNKSNPLKIDMDAYISSDATLKTSSKVKGEAVTSLGTPSATLGSETAGAVTITAAKSADTSNATTFVTLFEKSDSNATVKAVKYASGSSTEGFETDTAYANEAIADGDFFIINVTADDATTVNYYRINVEVTPDLSSDLTLTFESWNGNFSGENTAILYFVNSSSDTTFRVTSVTINDVPDTMKLGSDVGDPLGRHGDESVYTGWDEKTKTATFTIEDGKIFDLKSFYLSNQNGIGDETFIITTSKGGTSNGVSGASEVIDTDFITLPATADFQGITWFKITTPVGGAWLEIDDILVANITDVAVTSSDATLKASSTVKGQEVTSLGTPNAILGLESAGAVTISAAKAADTSNIGGFITSFDKNESNATMKVVKYSSGDSTTNFATDIAYNNEAITEGDFFIVKVTAQDSTTVKYYRINVEVTPVPSSTKAITAFNFNGLTPKVIGTVNEGAKTITLTVPYGTNVTSLVPIITHTGVSLSPNTGIAHNFTSPVTYTVTAADTTTQQYTVTVSVAANPINPAKTLTADTTSNSVDNDIEITFAEDESFRSGITSITYNGNTLTASQYDKTQSGKIILKPSVSDNTYLRTPGTANVVIKSTGYNDSAVSQTIYAGSVTSLEVTTQPVPVPANGNAFGTQPVVKLKDQYGNYCTTGVSSTSNVVATAKAGTGAWTIGGTTTKASSGGTATFTDLTCTLVGEGNGAITFSAGGVNADSTTFTIPINPAKTLTADTTSNSVDNDIEITFAEDAAFRNGITSITYNGNTLIASQYDKTQSGKIILKPSVSDNTYLRTPGTADVVIKSTGYNDSTVSQTINAGSVTSLEVTTQPVPGTANGNTFGTQPVVKLKDQYGNYCTTGVSSTSNVVATAKAGTGAWTIGGTTTKASSGGTATFTDLTCTLVGEGNGAITFVVGEVKADSTTFTIPINDSKTLTADTTSNSVDNDIEITFAEDAAFRNGITSITYNGNTLIASQYDKTQSGKIILKPSVSDNTYLRTPGTANVVIKSTGYNDSTVSQTIDHGAVTTMEITHNITAPASNGGQFAQQPTIELKDQYGNTCTTDNVTVVTVAKEDGGTWTLTGTKTATANSGIVTFTNLGATNTASVNNAKLGFTSGSITKITSTAVTLPSPAISSSGGGNGSGNGSTNTAPVQATIVIVNGNQQNAGKETISTENGQSIATVTVNNNVIEGKIDEAAKNNTDGDNNLIQIPIADTKSDISKVELTGDIVKKLENNAFNVAVKRDNVEYLIPAEELSINKVADMLGVLEKNFKDISIEVQIAKLDENLVSKYTEIAKDNGAELIFPPISFEVVAKTVRTDGTIGRVEINKFSNYVERVLEIPAGVDQSKITTGIVINSDGTYSHVPTAVYQKDGKWYARISSLTNSNYSVIWNPVAIKSVENHWSKNTVNDMAARMIIRNPEEFTPNKSITRADFAEYIVRALGIYSEGSKHENKFTDVSSDGDKTLAIFIADEYGIISGYPDGTFRPDALISREEAMAMYQRAMNVTKLTGADPDRYQSYTDYNKVSSWAKSSVKEVMSAHVFNGNTANTISPKLNLTYAEAAQAIRNLLIESKLINRQ